MVEITNGHNTFTVTAGAFKGIFSKQGYHVVSKQKADRKSTKAEVTGDDQFADLISKPIGRWSKAEMEKFVKAEGIDTTGVKNIAEVRSIIANYIKKL